MNPSPKPRSIVQTQQLIAGVAVLILKGRAIAADGKVGIFELLSLAKDWPVFKQALEGISEVPAELTDLSDDEAEQIGRQIAAFMVELGLPHRSGDVTKELIGLAAEAVSVWQRIVALPPRALPV